MALPSKSCKDPAFKYRRAAETDIRKTFARVRREIAAQAAEADQANQAAVQEHAVVLPMQRGHK